MKLRLRNHETRETLKLELPDMCTVHELQRRVSNSSPSSVHFSLNRKDELHASSPEESLVSVGVTSGDLIYYSLNPSAFRLPSQILGLDVNRQASNTKLADRETLNEESHQHRTIESDIEEPRSSEICVAQNPPNSDVNHENEETPYQNLGPDEKTEGSTEDTEAMDVDYDDVEIAVGKRLSEPYFLKKVLMDELSDTSELMLLVMAVHAVMLESGFVRFDQVSGLQEDRLSASNERHSISLRYTLPELIAGNNTDTIEPVCLKFQTLLHVVNVNGSLGKGSSVFRVYLDKRRFVPAVHMVMENLKSDKEGSSRLCDEVFEFWKLLKDGLVLPLLIDLCDKAGLPLPPCLMRLPTELKLKILESLCGVDIGRIASVCLEMRYLASNNDLWKQKCSEEFRSEMMDVNGSVNWKERYAFYWQKIKKQNRRKFPIRQDPYQYGFPTIRRDPYPFGFPRNFPIPNPVIWGDNDHPLGGILSPFGRRRLGQFNLGRGFSLNCNLGGFNA